MAVVEEKDIGTIKVKRRKPGIVTPAKPRIATHAMSDQIAEEDKLGFRDYVDAFVGLITSPDTKPPLTIGIYGPWGAGKSTLMAMIKDKLELQGAKKQNLRERIKKWFVSRKKELSSEAPELQTICFNAWLYSKEKKLWTAFMKKIFEGIEKNLSWKNKLKFFYSYPNRKLKRKIVSLLLIVLIFAVIGGFYYLLLEGKSALAGGAGFAGFAGWVVIAWHFFDAIKNPITSEMLSLIEKKGEKEDLELMPKIWKDTEFLNVFFGKIKPTPKIIIFVDDLDRCPDDTSVDVLESVSLLLNIEYFILILGVDEQVLRKAIKLRYKGLLDESNTFLDKIVQIPFHISQPTDPELKEYVSSLIGPKEGKTEVAGSNKKSVITTPIPLKENESERKQFIENTEYLPKNPREIKRLINIYRLVKILAGNKRGFEFIDNIENQSKLIKWLIICEQWPYFVKKFDLKSKSKETYNFLPNILTSTIEEYKKEIENQEKIKKFEEIINDKPILEAKDIADFIPFTINFYPS